MTLQAARQPIILDRTIQLTREVTEMVVGDVALGYDNLVRDTPDLDGTWALRRDERFFGTAASLATASLADTLFLQELDTSGDAIPTATPPFDVAVLFDDGARSIRWTVTATQTATTFAFDGRLTTVTTFALSAPTTTGAGDLDNAAAIIFYGVDSQEVTNEVQVETWAARVDPAPADDRVIRTGTFFFWSSRVYIVRWRADNLDPDNPDIGAQTSLIDEDGHRRLIVGIQEHGGRRRYHALATEGRRPPRR